MLVAPFAGAWIEIPDATFKLLNCTVAPFAGAWIEINYSSGILTGATPSLPSRERGLKSVIAMEDTTINKVAPFAGAWIEIQY